MGRCARLGSAIIVGTCGLSLRLEMRLYTRLPSAVSRNSAPCSPRVNPSAVVDAQTSLVSRLDSAACDVEEDDEDDFDLCSLDFALLSVVGAVDRLDKLVFLLVLVFCLVAVE